MADGFIKLHRKLLESWLFTDSQAVHLWVTLLLKASYTDREFMFNLQRHKLEKGQLITGRKVLAQETKIQESKIFRLLKCFEKEKLIEQQTNSRYSIITILNWIDYQESEQQMNSERTTSEQQVNTYKKVKKDKKERKSIEVFSKPTLEEIKKYCTEQNFNISAEGFLSYYDSNGWMVGRNKMKDWKATVRNWNTRDKNKQQDNIVKPRGAFRNNATLDLKVNENPEPIPQECTTAELKKKLHQSVTAKSNVMAS